MKTLTLKSIVAILCMAVMTVAVNAQSSSNKQASDSKPASKSSMEEWKELREFHKVMAQTFHPMEEGDYKPIRERSGEMAEKARVLNDAKVPAEFSKPEMLQAIKDLNIGSRELDAMIKSKATDDEVNKKLTALHDTFHKIVGLCQPGHHDHGHDHSDPNHKH